MYISDSISLNSSWYEKCSTDKSCRGNQNTNFMMNFFSLKSSVYETMWKKYGKARQATDENIIRRMAVESWIQKTKNTQSNYMIVIAFPRQQRLCDRASVLRFTYTALCCSLLRYVNYSTSTWRNLKI
jgi:hypothetical protein